MGTFISHTIVVEGSFGDGVDKAHQKATELGARPSPISGPFINGSRSFFIPPDGSKEYWHDSDEGDRRRREFVDYLRKADMLAWVEVAFGHDMQCASVVNHGQDVGEAEG